MMADEIQESVGSLLRVLRQTRGFSLGAVSLRAGVHKSTLSRWESGTQQPNIPELEAVLAALDATTDVRKQALSFLNAPRAVRRLRKEETLGSGDVANDPPHMGELLSALRFRQGATRDQAAERLGVHPSTLCRWERGEARPDRDFLPFLCRTLQARPEEIIALTRSLERNGGWPPDREYTEPDALEYRFRTHFVPLLLLSEQHPGEELGFLALEAALWRHALRREALRPLLGEVYAFHANYLRNFYRYTESEIYARKALGHLPRSARGVLPEWVPLSIICIVDAIAFRIRNGGSSQGIALMERWCSHSGLPLQYVAWMRRKMAVFVSSQGRSEDALTALRLGESVRLDDESAEVQAQFRQENRRYAASIFLSVGRAEVARTFLVEEDDASPANRVRDALLWARVCLPMGKLSEAQDWLSRAQSEVALHGLLHRQAEVDKVAAQF